jgi:hypothetical protein
MSGESLSAEAYLEGKLRVSDFCDSGACIASGRGTRAGAPVAFLVDVVRTPDGLVPNPDAPYGNTLAIGATAFTAFVDGIKADAFAP